MPTQARVEYINIIPYKNTLKKMTFSTYGSRVVPHLSTRHAQWCLTAEFGWDLVFPPWYDRMTILI